MSTRIIRSFADLDAMQGQTDHVLTLFSGGLDSSYVLKELAQRHLHAVTPVVPLDPTQPAWRDVLVVAFTKVHP